MLWQHTTQLGIPWLISANRLPSQLYQGGVARNRFIKTIQNITKTMQVIELVTHDYRNQSSTLSRYTQTTTAYTQTQACSIWEMLTQQSPAAPSYIQIGKRSTAILGQHDKTLCLDFNALVHHPARNVIILPYAINTPP